jgi:hypothetical protein
MANCNHWRDLAADIFFYKGVAQLSFPARVEGAHSDHAASASKKGGGLLPALLSKLARCPLLEGGLIGLPLRASNDINGPSKLARYLFRDGG